MYILPYLSKKYLLYRTIYDNLEYIYDNYPKFYVYLRDKIKKLSNNRVDIKDDFYNYDKRKIKILYWKISKIFHPDKFNNIRNDFKKIYNEKFPISDKEMYKFHLYISNNLDEIIKNC